MARPGEAIDLPIKRSFRKHKIWSIPSPTPNDSTHALDPTAQLQGLPQIPAKHLPDDPKLFIPPRKTQNASGQRLLKRAEGMFATAQEIVTATKYNRPHHRKRLERIMRTDGHTLFEYHATFVLQNRMESTSDDRDWAYQLVVLWNSLSTESRGAD